MSVELTKYQKQGLGYAIKDAGYAAEDFAYSEEPLDKNNLEYVSLTHRETGEVFKIRHSKNDIHKFTLNISEPGTTRRQSIGPMSWSDVERNLTSWAKSVKRETQAIDPWQQEAEDMANDDSLFTIDELPKVDKAIEASIDDLMQRAIAHGKKADQIENQLTDIKLLLQKSARTSTKREWIAIFKGIILEKLLDWGMDVGVFQSILHTLIASTQDIAQLAEHASRHMPQ